MPNNFESNFTRKLMQRVIPAFESERVLSRNVDTQLFSGEFNPNSGDTVDIKRPTDHTSTRTSTGDVTGTNSDIITGKASATVQDYFTVRMEYGEAAQSLEMGTDKDRFIEDAAARIVTDCETDFARFMMNNSGLRVGTPGTGVSSWGEVAEASALMKMSGVPAGNWCYALNPYSQVSLATEQRSLGVNPEVKTANERATVMENFAGMTVKEATTLATLTTGAGADRVGAIAVNPDVTYTTHKDSMKQSLAVSGFAANLVIAAGETIEITGRPRLNLSTRLPIVKADGSQVLYTGVVTQTVTLDGAGAGTLLVSGPAIFEAAGAYNTTESAVIAGDVVTLGGAESTVLQPNLFWRKDAFSMTSIKIAKLHSTDTVATTKDGLQLRVSMYSNGDANKQIVRLDFRPAYAALNPFMAGQGYGTP